MLARSKVVPKGMSIPRAELYAAVLNAYTEHVVKSALGDYITNRLSLTDSQIVLYWINNSKLQLKQWLRNRIIEIHRLTKRENWYYINSKNNIADLGTKRRAKLSDVLDNSIWVNGHDWAKLDKTQFPIQSFEELKLNKEEIKGYENEILKSEMIDVEWIDKHLEVIHSKSYAVLEKGVPDKVGERYLFSRYIMDPNKFRFRNVVRIVALIILFVKNLKIRIKSTNNPNTGLIIKNEIPAQFKFQNDVYLVTQGISPPLSTVKTD